MLGNYGSGDKFAQLYEIEMAATIGADAVVCMAFPGADDEEIGIRKLVALVNEAEKIGMPVIAESIPGSWARTVPWDAEHISKAARKSFEKRGMTIHTSASLTSLTSSDDAVLARIEPEGGEAIEAAFDRVILAVGITGNVEDLGLEGTGVQVERGHVVVDEWLATGEPGVYAIGDLVGPPWLAHKASHEGVLCVERLAGVAGVHPLDVTRVPGCTYTRPQVASVGLTERAAVERGHALKVGRFPFVANGKALAIGESEGLIKTIFDAATGELLGAHMFGPEVTELIQGFAIARTLEATEAELMHTIFPHPTLSESMHESVLDAFDRALNF